MATPLTMDGSAPTTLTPAQKRKKWIKYSSIAVASFLFFTIWKLPEAPIKNFIQGSIASELAKQGISLTARETSFSMLFGLKYKMEGVSLYLPGATKPILLDKLQVNPALFSLLLRRMGGSAILQMDDSIINMDFSSDFNGRDLNLDFDLDNVQLEKIKGLDSLLRTRPTGLVNGSISLNGNPYSLAELSGEVDIDFKNLVIPPFSLPPPLFLKIPQIRMTAGTIDANMTSGKLFINKLELGQKDSATDDLIATVTGNVQFKSFFYGSVMDLQSKFKFSQEFVNTSKLPLDMFLGTGRKPDGSYAFRFSGPFNNVKNEPLR